MSEQNAIKAINDAQTLLNYALEQLKGEPINFPIPEEQLKWENGNLWKPKADPVSRTPGKLVVVFRSDWPEPTSVQALTNEGVWETLTSSGQLEDGRWAFRGTREGKGYLGKRKGGGVRVFYGEDYGFIPHKKAPKFRQESIPGVAAPLITFLDRESL